MRLGERRIAVPTDLLRPDRFRPDGVRRAWPIGAAFVAGVGLLLLRLRLRLASPGIYAEDGLIFYVQGQTRGLGAILTPYAGYLHVIPRLGAAALSPWGLTAVPVGNALLSTALTVLAFVPVLSPRLEGLIPSARGRALAFVLLVLVPQLTESGARLAYLIFVGGISLLLLGCSATPRSRRGRAIEVMAVLLLGLSGPLVVFYGLSFVHRWWRSRTRHDLVLCGVVTATAATQLAVFATSRRPTNTFPVTDVPSLYLERVALELMAGTARVVGHYLGSTAAVVATGTWIVIVLLLIAIEGGLGAVLPLVLSIAAFCAAVVNYGPVLAFQWAGDRHFLVPGAMVVVLLVASLNRAVDRARSTRPANWLGHRGVAILAAAALLCVVGGIVTHFTLARDQVIPTRSELVGFQACMDSGRQDCRLAVSPVPFVMDLRQG